MTCGQLIVSENHYDIATRCRVLRPKCAKFDSWRVSVCPSVHSSLRWSL